jgi:hypothetical protein
MAPPAAGSLHRLGRRLCREELALEDDIDEAVILGFIDVEERLGSEDSCVIEQHVYPSEPIKRHLHSRLGGRRLRNIADMRHRARAESIDFLDGGFSLGGVAAIDDDQAALGDKPARHFLADAGISTCDDRNPFLKTHRAPPCLRSIDR